jgi:hypothetical protein
VRWFTALAVSVAAAAFTVFVILAGRHVGITEFDDAYAFIRYAKHGLAGHGFCWNIGEGPAYGCTSALHLLVVTAVRGATSLSDAAVLTGISFACSLLACVGLVALGFAVLDVEAPWRRGAPFLVVPCLLFGDGFRFHALTGMETTLAILCNVLLACCAVLAARYRTRLTFVLCLVAAYAAYLARPESGVYGLLFVPLYWVATDRGLAKRALQFAGLFVGLLAADALLKLFLWGDALPLPFYAKRIGFYRGYTGTSTWNVGEYTVQFLTLALPYLLTVVCLWTPGVRRRLLAIVVPVAVVFIYLASVGQIMGTSARFYYPSVPFVVLAAFVALAEFARHGTRTASPSAGRWPPRMLATLLLIILATTPYAKPWAARAWNLVSHPPRIAKPATHFVTPAGAPLASLGWWRSIREMSALMRRMPRDSITLACSEYGFVGASWPELEILDLVGLQDRVVAHRGFSAARVFARAPDIVWMPHPDYSQIQSAILDSPEFARSYEFFPTAYDYGLALRRGSPHHAAMRAALRAEFERLYPGRAIEEYVAEIRP